MPNFANFKKTYTTPGTSIAFSGLNHIYNYYEKQIPISVIEKELESVNSYSLHFPAKKVGTNPFFIYKRRLMFMIDLIDVQSMEQSNNNVKYLLTCIDCFSRYGWVRTCINKSSIEIFAQFKSIMDSIPNDLPHKLHSDKGLEIKNKLFNKYCKQNNIIQIYSENETKSALVERFNQSLQALLYKYLTYNETMTYIYEIQNLVDTYNNRWHRSLGMSPSEADSPSSHNVVFQRLRFKHFKLITNNLLTDAKYKIGTPVRISKYKEKFNRGYETNFTEEIFYIKGINTRMPLISYKLKDGNEEDVEGTFYEKELISVSANNIEYKINKILKTKGKGKNKKHYVSWKGYNDKFNSWIDANTIHKL